MAEQVGEAVANVLMERIELLGRSHQDVDKTFWVLDKAKEGYCEKTAGIASDLQLAMQGLLNVAEGLGDKEGFSGLADLFTKLFGILPQRVYLRIKDFERDSRSKTAAPVIVNENGRKNGRKGGEPIEASAEDIEEWHKSQKPLDTSVGAVASITGVCQ